MKSYRFYLDASGHFLSHSQYNGLDAKEREYYHVASIILSWVSLEAYVNSISKSLSQSTRLKSHEEAFLLEQQLIVDDKGQFKRRKIRPPTLNKILFIIHHFSKLDVNRFRRRVLWERLRAFEGLRHTIIHYKEKHDININFKKANECRELVKETINIINKLIFR